MRCLPKSGDCALQRRRKRTLRTSQLPTEHESALGAGKGSYDAPVARCENTATASCSPCAVFHALALSNPLRSAPDLQHPPSLASRIAGTLPASAPASAVYRRLRTWLALATIGRKHKPHRQHAQGPPKGRHGKDKNPNRGKAGRGWSMGQDESTIVDESIPPSTLSTRDLDGVAKFIRDGRAKKVVVMVHRLPAVTLLCS